jgi:L-seryl-tRNA(Ser) seleniumtransferase
VTRGGDLVCISAKYFGGPNAGGFVMGSKSLIEAVANVHFTRYESGKHLKFGRPLKLDRQTVVAVTVALEEWLETDHAARLRHAAEQVALLQAQLARVPGLVLEPMCFTMDERFVPEPVNCLVIRFEPAGGASPASLARRLADGDPSILAVEESDKLAIVMDVMSDGEVMIVADRIRRAMAERARG